MVQKDWKTRYYVTYYPTHRNLKNILKELHLVLPYDEKYQKVFPNVPITYWIQKL